MNRAYTKGRLQLERDTKGLHVGEEEVAIQNFDSTCKARFSWLLWSDDSKDEVDWRQLMAILLAIIALTRTMKSMLSY